MDFYLFDVNHGQSAAVKLPNGRWCIFDVGSKSDFSPIQWIMSVDGPRFNPFFPGASPPFRFLKATISHLHGDHLADYARLFMASPEFLKIVDFDLEYLRDVANSSTPDSLRRVYDFCRRYRNGFGPTRTIPDYGGVAIQEMGLPVSDARWLGGSAVSRVNNASVITRIDCYGNSILLCGDMEKEAWEFVLTNPFLRSRWRPFVTGIDVLVAPHHGHKSGYSTELLDLARPSVVLVSVVGGDDSVDSRYSGAAEGITVNGRTYKSVTTRTNGHIHISIAPPTTPFGKGVQTWHNL
ncbi:MAG TPA: hypothetical protein VFD30_09325 [Terriglobia bacterium]|nr:hypothetical protein [Terriglobia bacterium]